MGLLNALRGAGSDAMRESASLTTAYLLEQNRKFEAFMREKIAQLESRVNVQRSRLSLKAVEEEPYEEEPEWSGGAGPAEPEPAGPEPEASYVDAWTMVDFQDLRGLSRDDGQAEPGGVAGPPRAASKAQPEPPDWMSALIGAPVSQPQEEALEVETSPAEAQEGEAFEVQSPPAHGEEDRLEMDKEHTAEPSTDGGDALGDQAAQAPSPAEEAENLPQPEAVQRPLDAGQALLEAEEPAPPDGKAGEVAAIDAFVSPWLWSTAEEEALARPVVGLDTSPDQSPLAESVSGRRPFASVQPLPGAPAQADPAFADDLEDGDGGWEGALPQEPPGAWA